MIKSVSKKLRTKPGFSLVRLLRACLNLTSKVVAYRILYILPFFSHRSVLFEEHAWRSEESPEPLLMVTMMSRMLFYSRFLLTSYTFHHVLGKVIYNYLISLDKLAGYLLSIVLFSFN